MTYGWLAGELVRRVDPKHRSLGTFVQQEIVSKVGGELWIGLPESQESRVSPMIGGLNSIPDDLDPAVKAMMEQFMGPNSPGGQALSLNGAFGIEGAFNDYLKGEPGEEVEQRISTGWKKIGPVIKEPVEGANVVTTIDKVIQEVAHTELLNQLQKQDAESGCVIVMDVKTGFVKAIVNLNKHKNGNYYESYNKAIGSKEVPGSTFKLGSKASKITATSSNSGAVDVMLRTSHSSKLDLQNLPAPLIEVNLARKSI